MKKYLWLLLMFPFIGLEAQVNDSFTKVSNYDITASFFPSTSFMQGKASVQFSRIDKNNPVFYLHGELNTDSIIVNGTSIEFNQERVFYYYNYCLIVKKVTMDLAVGISADTEIDIYYSGYFNPSFVRTPSDFMRINEDEGILLRSYGYSLWFPVFLDSEQESYETNFENVTVQTPLKYKAVVAGFKLDEFENDSTRVTIWKPGIMKIDDIQCVARDYRIAEKDNIIVYHLDTELSFENSDKIIDLCIKLRALFEKRLMKTDQSMPMYILEMPKYGNISSGNVVGIATELFHDFGKQDYKKLTLAHELVHPYVQLPVSIDNPFYAFVMEGFPSYFQIYALLETGTVDEEWNTKYMLRIEDTYLYKKENGMNKRGWKTPIEKPILEIKPYEIGSYKDKFVLSDRVWLFFNYLRQEMGKDDYNNFVMELFKFKTINYNKFEKLILKSLPEIKEDLNTWLNTTYFPEKFHLQGD